VGVLFEMRRQTTVGGETAIFSGFGVFGSFRNKANIIVQYYLIPHWLSINPKTYNLEYLEWPFYVCDDDDHFADE